ncbi:hypothetical protein LZ32DRAFT_600476 [Colletotrichum eremochloae]|nr:hypothetical protein LZ32DRAFT_600476 [Colletotrichum eremochloae]
MKKPLDVMPMPQETRRRVSPNLEPSHRQCFRPVCLFVDSTTTCIWLDGELSHTSPLVFGSPSSTIATDSWQPLSLLSLSLRSQRGPPNSAWVVLSVSSFSHVSCPSSFSCFCPSPHPLGQGAAPFVSYAAGKEDAERAHGWRAGKPTQQSAPRARVSHLSDRRPPPASPPIPFENGRRSVSVVVWCLKGPGYYTLPRIPKGDGDGGGGGGGIWKRRPHNLLLPVFVLLWPLLLLHHLTLPLSVSLSNLQAAPARSVGNSPRRCD